MPSYLRCPINRPQGDLNTAMVEFRQAAKKLHNGRQNASGLLAQAALHFNGGRYSVALDL